MPDKPTTTREGDPHPDGLPTQPSKIKYWLLSTGVAVMWLAILYRLWRFEPRIVSGALGLMLIVGVGWLAVKRVRSRRTASIRSLVLVLPVGIAIACLPLRTVLQHLQMRDALQRAGVEDYSLEASGLWERMLASLAGHVLGNSLTGYVKTQLVMLDVQLETADLAELYPLSSQELRLVSIKRGGQGIALTPELIEWVNGSRHNTLVTIALENPTQTEIQCLRELQSDSIVSFSNVTADGLQIDIPSAFDFTLSDCDISSTNAFQHIEMPRVLRWHLTRCQLGESEVLFEALARAQDLSVIDASLTPAIANRLVRLDIRDMTLGDLQFPKDIRWTTQTAPLEANSLFLWGCNLNGRQVLELLGQRSCRFVYINLDSEFSTSEVAALLRMPRTISLRLTGAWITPAHLQSLSDLSRPLRLSILDSSMALEQVDWLNQSAAPGVRLFVNEVTH